MKTRETLKENFQIVNRLIPIFIFYFFAVPSESFAQEKPNIVWIVCEDISPIIGTYGNAIINTPNIDELARESMVFSRVYTTAGVCAPSRSSIITGMYPMSIGTEHMRTNTVADQFPEAEIPNYSAVLPSEVKAFPEYLRRNGYYTTNNHKEDYQFEEPVTVWDESSPAASYEYRADGQPFFSVYNLAISHESNIINRPDSIEYDPNEMELPLFYEDTPTVREDFAVLYTRIEAMDEDLGEIIAQLKEDGLYEESYIFFYSDHGGNLPWMKRELLERGTHIPFMVKFPRQEYAATINHELVSGADFAPTVLSIAGIEPPRHMQGKAFLGKFEAAESRKYAFSGRDRNANKYDRVRAVTDGSFRYIYNFNPELPKYQDTDYRKGIASMQEILQMREEGKISNPYLKDWFVAPKPQEELYYTKKDPDEVHNLADNPQYASKLKELKEALFSWIEEVGDLSAIPEREMVVENWWNMKLEPPKTSTPQINKVAKGVKITCATEGASIGYQILSSADASRTEIKPAKSWDFGYVGAYNGGKDKLEVPLPWKVYTGEIIDLKQGEVLLVNAHRIGYEPSEITYTSKQPSR